MRHGLSSLVWSAPRPMRLVALGVALLGCGAVYPEVASPIKAVPEGRTLNPPPPRDLLFIQFARAEIPPTTRDGRRWDSVGGNAPDPVARLFVDDKELITTPIQRNTTSPTWPDQKKANYRIRPGARIRVELWDSNPINNTPICIKRVLELHDSASLGSLDLRCNSGATVTLTVEPAHAKFGLGLYYELRTEHVFVTRVLKESPAARAGLTGGEEILGIQGRKVAELDEDEVRSLINANAQLGVKLMVKKGEQEPKELELKEGPVYPLRSEPIAL